MSEFKHDPKGYYNMLGVAATADAEAIKSAYRTKAKRLHPDINPSPIAAKQFQRLTEAYEILSDAKKRTKYDESSLAAKEKAKAERTARSDSKTREAPKTKPEAKPQAKKKESPSGAASSSSAKHKTETKAKTADAVKPEVCQCGKVTAQPRYIVFDMVSGAGTKVRRKAVAGVYCRSCADWAALKASFITWIAGWWAWPSGPKETVKALWNNIRGGRKPADRNTRLLLRQAQAFRDRGDTALARGIAEQALLYARTPGLRREVDSLLLSLSFYNAKHLKTRWNKPGWAQLVQVLPVLALVVWGSLTLTMNAPVSITAWVQDLAGAVSDMVSGGPDLVEGGRAEVSTPALNVRTGPGADYSVIVVVSRGTVVTVAELSPDGDWARVMTEDGALGFVPVRAVMPLP